MDIEGTSMATKSRYTLAETARQIGRCGTTVRMHADRLRLGRRNAAGQREFTRADIEKLRAELAERT